MENELDSYWNSVYTEFIMNTGVRFVKSFSKGQITIPKEIRDMFGIGDEFWLKLSVDAGKIIAEPVKKGFNKKEWIKKLLKMPPLDIDIEELAENRKQIEKKIKSRAL